MSRDMCSVTDLKPALTMVLVQAIFAGLNIFIKIAAKDGMDMSILVAYRLIFATIFLAPIAFFVERNKRPNLTWMVIFQTFLCGLLGGPLTQNLYVSSLLLTSVTFAAAMTNLIPATTYLIAVISGQERLGIRSLAGKAKLVGTAIGIGGAMVLTFYKGVQINIPSMKVDVTHGFGKSAPHQEEPDNRILGALLSLGCCISYSLWLIIQARMSEIYPCDLSSTALTCLMGSIQSVIYCICVEKKWEDWKLGWNIRLWTVAYGGILATGLIFTMITWAVRARGALFVSVFDPMELVLVTIMSFLLLNEKLHSGSLVGSALIVVGLYVVLWGKGKESKTSKESEKIEVVVTSITPSSVTIDTSNNRS